MQDTKYSVLHTESRLEERRHFKNNAEMKMILDWKKKKDIQERNFENEGDPHLYDSYIQKTSCIITVRRDKNPFPRFASWCLTTRERTLQQDCGTHSIHISPNGEGQFIWVTDNTPSFESHKLKLLLLFFFFFRPSCHLLDD